MIEKIVVVHNDPAIQRLLDHALLYILPDVQDVVCFTSCTNAFLCILEDINEGRKIAIIVGSDRNDTEMSAFKLVEAVREHSEKIPIMMASGGGSYFAKEAGEAGANCLLRMPFSLAELQEKLQLLFPNRVFPT